MAKPKNLEQLRAEKEQVETQLAQEQHKLRLGLLLFGLELVEGFRFCHSN